MDACIQLQDIRQVATAENGPDKQYVIEVPASEVRVTKIRPAEVRPSQIGLAKAGVLLKALTR
jgi:hypothetical protein